MLKHSEAGGVEPLASPNVRGTDAPSASVQTPGQELRSFDTVRRWLKDLKPTTHRHGLVSMRIFIQKNRMTPDEFLAFAESHKPVEVQDLIDTTGEGEKDYLAFNMRSDLRSFLRHNGFNNLPKIHFKYQQKNWHRRYRKNEVSSSRGLLSYLPFKLHKLAVTIGLESGLRIKHEILALCYKHVQEDFEADPPILPVAIRLGPEFYRGSKTAGFTFLGRRSVELLKQCIREGLVKTEPESRLVPVGYSTLHRAVKRAAKKAGLDPLIQPFHGLRKYFESSLDEAHMDHEIKMVIEGRLSGINAKHYTDRDWTNLREHYKKAYTFIDPDNNNPELAIQLAEWQREKQELLEENHDLSKSTRLALVQSVRQHQVLVSLLTRMGREFEAVQKRLGDKPDQAAQTRLAALNKDLATLRDAQLTSLSPAEEVLIPIQEAELAEARLRRN